MILRDFHVHTDFCDGHDSPEETVKKALSKGVKQLGLVVHSYVPFDDCCVAAGRVGEFQGEIRRLREKYRGQIELYCGVEQDLYSPAPTEGFDYVIGSVHYFRRGEEYLAVDNTPEILKEAIERWYGGDFYACAESYFSEVEKLKDMNPDIIGHFDLIKKFSGSIPFDSGNERYRAAWKKAADVLLKTGARFEINTGGISRGYISENYPSDEILNYLRSAGGRFILSSDAHCGEDVCRGFEKLAE